MIQVRIPRDFPVVGLEHLSSIAASPSDRRNALAALSLVTSSLAPRSYVSTKPLDTLGVQFRMGPREISQSIKLLVAARAINLVRRDRRLLIAVTQAAAGARATDPDLVVRRRLDDAVVEIFNRACATVLPGYYVHISKAYKAGPRGGAPKSRVFCRTLCHLRMNGIFGGHLTR
jgi:hypothetical protein